MWPRTRTIFLMLLLGVLTSAVSVVLIAYWPRGNAPYYSNIDRDRNPQDGEGRGFISQRYVRGFGYQQAFGWASQQFVTGGYNYASNTEKMPWPDAVAREATPWLFGTEPWPADGVSRQVMVLSVGWPMPMLRGSRTQTLRAGRDRFPIPEDPANPVNVITTRDWRETQPMWTPYGGWAYMNAPAWLKDSRLGAMMFNKSQLPAIPTRPLWPGIIVNTALFACAWWGLITVTGKVRRAIRLARTAGRCEWCRYPRAGLEPGAPCPECGKRPGRDSNPRPVV